MLRVLIVTTSLLTPFAALAQDHGSHAGMGQGAMQGGMHGAMPEPGSMSLKEPGQSAFATIAEIVARLESDPKTDWSKVDIGALREHLVDMDLVTLRSKASENPLDNGLSVVVTGEGRVGVAIRRMVTAHARELAKFAGWRARTEQRPNGVTLVVTSDDPRQAARIRGLGFYGLMASGAHHQPHHWAIASGRNPH